MTLKITSHALRRLKQRYKYKKSEKAVYCAYKCETIKIDRGRQIKKYQGYLWIFEDKTLITLYWIGKKRII